MTEETPNAEEEKIAEPEVNPADAATGFRFSSFREFLKFVEYVGEGIQIEFASPIYDATGAVLVQRGVHFRQSMLKNLWQFFNAGNLKEDIIVADTRNLHGALRERVCKSLFRCLQTERFHVAQALADVSQMNLSAVVANIIQRRDILPVFIKLDQAQDPILPHLGEVALVAAGFAEQFCKTATNGKNTREIVRRSALAGLLHDLALTDDDDFLQKDIEKIKESDHARKSAEMARSLIPGLSPEITDIIEHHHRQTNPYDAQVNSPLTNDHIATEVVAFSEYIFVQLRSQYRKDESMSSVELLFYELGRAFGQGKFHPQLKSITASTWERLFAALHYGYEIGVVESKCLHKPSAIAYPNPRATQVMCHNDVSACPNYVPQFPLEILQATRYPGKPGSYINPGRYSKCKLAEALPKGMADGKVASDWLDKRRVTD